MTAKMHGVSAVQKLRVKCGYGNARCFQLGQRTAQTIKIACFCQNDDVAIAAKLRRAVQHASLTAHQQVPNPMA